MDQNEFHFDFGSPNAYLAHKVLPGFTARTGATFTYVPVLIGGVFKLTNNQPPIAAFRDVRGKLAYQQREIDRFVARHGITAYRFNPHFPVNSLLIMRGAVAADMSGVLAPYTDAVFCAMWEDGLKMDDPAIVAPVLRAAHLDAAGLLARTQEQAVKDRLTHDTQRSVDRGAFGSPTFFVGEEMYFGKNSLREMEEDMATSKQQ